MNFKYALFREPRVVVTLLLGFASGLPLALTSSTLQAWFSVSNISLKEIGFLALVGIPATFKFLWAPLMDRWVPPLLGRRRGWIVLCQGCLLVSIGAMAFFNPENDARVLFCLAAFVAFLSASQDIAVDAYRTDVLRADERALGAAMGVNGYRIAMLISGGVALIIADKVGWQAMYLFMASLMLIGMVSTIMGPDPEHLMKPPTSFLQCTKQPFLDFFKRPNAIWILLFIVFYKLGDAFAGTLTTTFLLREVEMTLSEVGSLIKFSGFVGTILGTTVGALYINKLGWFRALLIFGVLQAVSNLSYLFLLYTGPNYWVAGSSIFAENFCGGMGTAAFVGLLMGLCNPRFTAFQYALLSSLSVVGRVYIGPLAGFIVADYGWIHYFLGSVVLSIPGLILLCIFKNSIGKMTETQTLERESFNTLSTSPA